MRVGSPRRISSRRGGTSSRRTSSRASWPPSGASVVAPGSVVLRAGSGRTRRSASAIATPGSASHQNAQRQDSTPASAPLATRPVPAPMSSPLSTTPHTRARSRASNMSPMIEASVGPAVAVTAPSATRASSRPVSDVAAPHATIAADQSTTLHVSRRTRLMRSVSMPTGTVAIAPTIADTVASRPICTWPRCSWCSRSAATAPTVPLSAVSSASTAASTSRTRRRCAARSGPVFTRSAIPAAPACGCVGVHRRTPSVGRTTAARRFAAAGGHGDGWSAHLDPRRH